MAKNQKAPAKSQGAKNNAKKPAKAGKQAKVTATKPKPRTAPTRVLNALKAFAAHGIGQVEAFTLVKSLDRESKWTKNELASAWAKATTVTVQAQTNDRIPPETVQATPLNSHKTEPDYSTHGLAAQAVAQDNGSPESATPDDSQW